MSSLNNLQFSIFTTLSCSNLQCGFGKNGSQTTSLAILLNQVQMCL
jgi:hypothetical protein